MISKSNFCIPKWEKTIYWTQAVFCYIKFYTDDISFLTDCHLFYFPVADIPQSPGPILLVENVPDTVTLTWEPSPTEKRESNVNYMVMKRDSCKGSWEMVADLIYTNKCTVTDLIPRREYYFRVLAKNYMGMSEPSETVQPWSIQKTKGK